MLNKRHVWCVIIGVVVLVIATASFTAWAVNSFVSKACGKGFFYRTPTQLSADEVTLVSLDEDIERELHSQIWDYYVDEYPEIVKTFLENSSKNVELKKDYEYLLNNFDEVQLSPLLFSAPRSHEGIDDVIAVVASACMQLENIKTCAYGTKFFFFRKDARNGWQMDMVLPIGEGFSVYESGPWDRYDRETATMQ